nr:hypothetical protein [Mycobacterium uberis]
MAMQRQLATELRIELGNVEIELQDSRRDLSFRGTSLRLVPVHVDGPADTTGSVARTRLVVKASEPT